MKINLKSIAIIALFLSPGLIQANNIEGEGLLSSNSSESNKEITKKASNMKVIEIKKDEFKTKVFDFEKNPKQWKFIGKRPCIVDFFATWCGPCKRLAPILEELAQEYQGRVDFYKVDVDKSNDLASAFGIRSIPTLLILPMDKQPKISQGALSKSQLKEIIENDLLK